MLDMIPGASPVQIANPATPTIPAIGSPGPATALPRGDAKSSALPATPPQPGSFASTLQSRLKTMALNKAAASPHTAAAATGSASNTRAQAVRSPHAEDIASAVHAVLEANNNLLVSKDAATDSKTDEIGDKAQAADAAPPVGVTDANQATQAMIAAVVPNSAPASATNSAAPIATPAASQASGRPVASISADGEKKQDQSRQEDSSPDPAAPAMLAATAEKSALPAANNDRRTDGKSFEDILNTRTVNSANPSLNHSPVASIVSPPVREVHSSLASAHWASDVGNQLTWMANRGESRADLVLNPPQLGRIEVSITMNGDQASASFVSANPEVREALQGSLPRLREVLADAGVFLGQANVGAESFGQNQNGAEKGGKSPDDPVSSLAQSLLGSSHRAVPISSVHTSQGQGLVDLFA